MKNLDQKIIAVQKSTRTTFPRLSALHNKLRAKFPWYYSWHVKPFANITHQLILLIYVLNIVVFVLFSSVLTYRPTTNIAMKAASEQTTLNTKAVWEAGTSDNIDTTSSVNQMKMANFSNGPVDLSSAVTSVIGDTPVTYDDTNIDHYDTAAISQNDYAAMFDNDQSTYYTMSGITGLPWPWHIHVTLDFGDDINIISQSHCLGFSGEGYGNTSSIEISGDGSNWTTVLEAADYVTDSCNVAYPLTNGPAGNNRYARLTITSPMEGQQVNIKELGLNALPATATHTTAADQLDGGSNFLTWETFTPTQTVSDNATIQYRFRTSTDGSTWTAWTAYQSGTSFDLSKLVTNSVGTGEDITYYKYLQIEAKLTSLDGVSTPIITDYTVNHHTNRAPTAPAEPSTTVDSGKMISLPPS